ncbi:MAG: hypothetical protein ACKN9O_01950 [Actinomycetota bacterium]
MLRYSLSKVTRIFTRVVAFTMVMVLAPTAEAVETDVNPANFSISIKGSKQITRSSGKITINSTVNEKGRWCVYLYVLDMKEEELEKLKEDPINNLMNHDGLDVFPNGAKINGYEVLKNMCDEKSQKPTQVFSGKKAIPQQLGFKKPMKSGTYSYVAVLAFSNDPRRSKYSPPGRFMAISDFIKVKVKL